MILVLLPLLALAAEPILKDGPAAAPVAAPVAAPAPDTVHAVRVAEWSRAPASAFAAWTLDSAPEVRAAAGVALGRLRAKDALPLLRPLLDDPDAGVRVAAVEALGWTPGSAALLRERLAAAPRPAGWANARGDAGELPLLLISLGRVGEEEDVARLRPWLADPWPVGAAAADALGRLARRSVAGVADAVPDLLRCAERLDVRTSEACAFAVSRLTVTKPEVAMPAVARIGRLPSERGRAWLIKGLWHGLDADARTGLFVGALRSGERLVQVAALDAVEEGDLSTDLVAPWVYHADGWVRSAAVAALGRLGTPESREALERFARDADRWAAADAIAAAGDSEAGAASDGTLPAPIRAAIVAGIDDLGALLDLASNDPEPAVRSAAAGAIVEHASATWRTGLELLASPDPALREAAFELLDHREDAIGAAIVAAAPTETDPEVLRAELDALADLAKADPKRWTAARVAPALGRASAFSSARVAAAAGRLAALVGAPAPARPASDGERTVALAGGTTAPIGPEQPGSGDLAGILSVVVRTERGEFVIDLDEDAAPLAVWNFVQLAEVGFFDDRPVHRLVPGFVMQTGCPRGDGWGGPGWTIPDEPGSTPFAEGSVGMARSDFDTGGSQWFVTLADTPHLTGDYTRFGQVVHGMSVVRHLARGDRILAVTVERVAPAAL